MRGEIVQIHLREQKKKEKEKSRVSNLRHVRRKTRVSFLRKQETELQQQASPCASAFSRHIVTHIPPPPNHWSYYSSYYHYYCDFTTIISPHPLPDKAVCAL